MVVNSCSRTIISRFRYQDCWADENEDGHLSLDQEKESEKSTANAKHVDIRFKFICHYAHALAIKPIFVNLVR